MLITFVSYVKRISRSLEAASSVATITHKIFQINYTGKEKAQLPLIDWDFVSQLSLVDAQFH